MSPCAHSDANASAAAISASVLHERRRDHEARRAARGDVAAARLDPGGDQQVGDRRDDEGARSSRPAAPTRARRRATAPAASGALGRDDARRGTSGCVCSDAGGSKEAERSSSLRIHSTHRAPAARRARRSAARRAARRRARRGRSAPAVSPAARAAPTSASRSSPTCQRLLRARRPRARARARGSPGPAWRAPTSAEDTAPSSSGAQPGARRAARAARRPSSRRPRAARPAARSSRSAGTASGNGSKRIAASSTSVSAPRSSSGAAERVAQHLRARAPQRREAGRVAAELQVRAVEADLGPHRPRPPRPRRPSSPRRSRSPARSRGAGGTQLEQRAEGVDRDRTNRLPRHAGEHCTAPRRRRSGPTTATSSRRCCRSCSRWSSRPLLDRYFARRGAPLAAAVTRGRGQPRARHAPALHPAADLRDDPADRHRDRACRSSPALSKLAASILASGALAAAIIGFAARQTLANVVAGIMLAITQPLRVGDWVTFEEHYGVVEDVRLNYTVLRTASDQRVVIPNERLAAGILRNDTLGSDSDRRSTSRSGSPRAPTSTARSPRSRTRPGARRRSPRSRADGVRITIARRSGAAAAEGPAPGRAARAVPRKAALRGLLEGLLARESRLLGESRQGYTRWFAPLWRARLQHEPVATQQATTPRPRSPSEQGLPRHHGACWCSSPWPACPRSAT